MAGWNIRAVGCSEIQKMPDILYNSQPQPLLMDQNVYAIRPHRSETIRGYSVQHEATRAAADSNRIRGEMLEHPYRKKRKIASILRFELSAPALIVRKTYEKIC